MPIDMTDYKMIYNDQVFNVLSIATMTFVDYTTSTPSKPQLKTIQAVYIDENGEVNIIEDEANKFRFVRR